MGKKLTAIIKLALPAGKATPAPPVGPIGLLPPPASPVGGAEIAQEFRWICTTANLTVCVAQCN